MKKFEVSIIIPVYNAENYITNAVESALLQQEVGEVMLIEDNSPDNSLQICRHLAKEHDRVKLYQHPNGENRGAGASRNLGIEKATCPFIAFLDADDWYLENRFEKAREIFQNHPDADGVYDAIGTYFEDEEARKKWFKYNNSKLTTTNKPTDPDKLLSGLIIHVVGYFSTDGITVKKSIFNKVGLFDTELEISQDTHMWIKMAAKTRLYAGDIENPRAIRRVHAGNRWSTTEKRRHYFKKKLFEKLVKWSDDEGVSIDKRATLYFGYLLEKARKPGETMNTTMTLNFLYEIFKLFIKKPFFGLLTLFSAIRRFYNKIC